MGEANERVEFARGEMGKFDSTVITRGGGLRRGRRR